MRLAGWLSGAGAVFGPLSRRVYRALTSVDPDRCGGPKTAGAKYVPKLIMLVLGLGGLRVDSAEAHYAAI